MTDRSEDTAKSQPEPVPARRDLETLLGDVDFPSLEERAARDAYERSYEE